MMAVARTLLRCGDSARELYLFDTFEGMPSPSESDIHFTGRAAEPRAVLDYLSPQRRETAEIAGPDFLCGLCGPGGSFFVLRRKSAGYCVDGRPTLLCNAETLAQLAMLARLGTAGYAALGTPAEPGTALLTVSGAVTSPGVLEVPLGTRLGTVAAAAGALRSQAVVIGGYHGAWLSPDPDLELSRAGLAAAGGTLGAGVLIFVGEQTCPLAELARVAGWLAAESVRQCGPCTFGLPALATELARLAAGASNASNVDRLTGVVTGRGACAHPDGAARFIRSGLAALAGELSVHRAYGSCRRADLGQLATVRKVWR